MDFDSCNTCYWCMRNYTVDNPATEEHIIPNALGGRLKSKILCKECNSKLGEKGGLDSILIEYLKFFRNIINQRNDRKTKNPGIYVKDLKGNLVFRPPRSEEGCKAIIQTKKDEKGFNYKIDLSGHISSHKNKEDIIDILKNDPRVQQLAQKAKKSIDNFIQDSNISIEINRSSTFNYNFKKPSFLEYNSIIKILLNYCIHKNLDVKYINDIKKSLIENESNKSNIVLSPDPEYLGGILGHFIKLIGNEEEEVLYGAVSLYGYLNAVILLNNNYKGPSFVKNYAYDLLSNTDISLYKDDVFDNLSKQDLNNIFFRGMLCKDIIALKSSGKSFFYKIKCIHRLI